MDRRIVGLAALIIGCGGSGSASDVAGTSVTGSFLGQSFAAAYAVSASVPDPRQPHAAVVISTSAAVCSALQAGRLPAGSRNLVLHLYDIDASMRVTAPTALGTYSLTDALVGPARLAGASYVETDASCKDVAVQAELVQRGTVELTGNENGSYSGTFGVSMTPTADAANGVFKSAPCPGARLDSPAPGC